MKPILSIIIITYNHENEIRNCLQSIIQYLPPKLNELIIVDNHSTDHTISEIEKLKFQFKPDYISFHIIRNKINLGYTKATNQGLVNVSGRFVLLLNPDTKITEKSIENMIQFLSNHPEAGAVAPKLLFPNGEIQPSCRRFPKFRYLLFEVFGLSRLFKKSKVFNSWKMGDFDHQSIQVVDQPQGACLLVRREIFQSTSNLDKRFFMFFSDVDLCKRIYQLGYKIYFYPIAEIFHSKGTSIYANRTKMTWQSHKDFIRYFLKWYKTLFGWICNVFGIPFLLFVGFLRVGVYKLMNLIKRGNLTRS